MSYSTATNKCSFSTVRRVKSWLRMTMDKAGVNGVFTQSTILLNTLESDF